MNKEQIKKLKEYIKEEEKQYNFNGCIEDWFKEEDLKKIEEANQLKDYLINLNEDKDITNIEVIYYSNAIEYLAENDASFKESLEIASDYGYLVSDLNSEILASLLMSKNNEEDYYKFIENVIEFAEEKIFNNASEVK